jgi:membrane protein DedA with SNARE-associated domain
VVLGLSRRVGLGEERIGRQATRLRGGGARAVAVSRMTPGLRIVAIAAAAFAALPFARFVAGLAVGNGVFVGGHFVAGFALGPAAAVMVSVAGIGVAVVVAIGIAGLVAWRLVRSRRTVGGPAEPRDGVAEWTDASCPACLVVAVAVSRFPTL